MKLQEHIKVREDFQFLPIAQGNQFRDKIKKIILEFRDSNKKVKLKYFDNFVLGLILLDFFRTLYNIDKIECRGVRSNTIEAVCEFRDNILYPMTSLTVENRIDPKEVVKRMKKILCKLNIKLNTNKNNKNNTCTILGGNQ